MSALAITAEAPARTATVVSAAASALVFLTTTLAGRLVALTLAATGVMSAFELGISYQAKAFAGAAIAVTATVVGELGFGVLARVPAHAWRAVWRGAGALGGAIFASGGLNALELPMQARVVLLLVIAWIAVGPVLAEVAAAYNEWARGAGDDDRRAVAARRTREGAAGLRALLGSAAFWALAAYGVAQILPEGLWLTAALPLALVAAVLSVGVLARVSAAEFEIEQAL